MTPRIPQSSTLSRLSSLPTLAVSRSNIPHSAALSALRFPRVRSAPIPPTSTLSRRFATTMNADERKHYLADQPPTVVRLEVEKHFEALNDQQKRYAHAISK